MKRYMYFIRGIGTGMVVGAGLAVTVKALCANNKKLCRKTGTAAKQLSDIMNSLHEMLN